MFTIDNMSRIPVYEQIVEQAERLLLSGQMKPGDAMPSVRGLATELGVNPNTIQKSYAELIRRGIIIPAPGSGTYVAPDALLRIREAAEGKLLHLSDLVSELALAGIPESDVIATVTAAYQQSEKEKNTFTATQTFQEGGTNS